jgi:hypothetical protein
MQELAAINVGLVSYGNNFQSGDYWSASENGSPYAFYVDFSSLPIYFDYYKGNPSYVRCVEGGYEYPIDL